MRALFAVHSGHDEVPGRGNWTRYLDEVTGQGNWMMSPHEVTARGRHWAPEFASSAEGAGPEPGQQMSSGCAPPSLSPQAKPLQTSSKNKSDGFPSHGQP